MKLPVRQEIAELVGLLGQETLKSYALKPGWCWGYACRKIRGSNTWSNHAWGLAVDLNAPENPMGPRTGKIRKHPNVIALWKSYGFRWGGDYSARADDMHFEFMGSVTDAHKQTDIAKLELDGEEVKPKEKIEMLTFGVKSNDPAIGGVWLLHAGTAYHVPIPEDLERLGKGGVPHIEEMSEEFLKRFPRIHPVRKNLPK